MLQKIMELVDIPATPPPDDFDFVEYCEQNRYKPEPEQIDGPYKTALDVRELGCNGMFWAPEIFYK